MNVKIYRMGNDVTRVFTCGYIYDEVQKVMKDDRVRAITIKRPRRQACQRLCCVRFRLQVLFFFIILSLSHNNVFKRQEIVGGCSHEFFSIFFFDDKKIIIGRE